MALSLVQDSMAVTYPSTARLKSEMVRAEQTRSGQQCREIYVPLQLKQLTGNELQSNGSYPPDEGWICTVLLGCFCTLLLRGLQWYKEKGAVKGEKKLSCQVLYMLCIDLFCLLSYVKITWRQLLTNKQVAEQVISQDTGGTEKDEKPQWRKHVLFSILEKQTHCDYYSGQWKEIAKKEKKKKKLMIAQNWS